MASILKNNLTLSIFFNKLSLSKIHKRAPRTLSGIFFNEKIMPGVAHIREDMGTFSCERQTQLPAFFV